MANQVIRSVRRILVAAMCSGLALTSPDAAGWPTMGRAEAIQLFSAAGLSIAGGQPANRCGTPANPKVTFVDINGDRKPEESSSTRAPNATHPLAATLRFSSRKERRGGRS